MTDDTKLKSTFGRLARSTIPQPLRTNLKARWIKKTNPNAFVFIHVGKCGGTTIASTMRDKENLDFLEIHMVRPPVHRNLNYLISLRNPLSRFVSAFRYHKRESEKPRFKNTRVSQLVAKYADAESFVAGITMEEPGIGRQLVEKPNLYGHLGKGIDFYLGAFLDRISAKSIKFVFLQEHLDDDIKHFFGTHATKKFRFAGGAEWQSQLSHETSKKLRSLLYKDYVCITKLYAFGVLDRERLKVLFDVS